MVFSSSVAKSLVDCVMSRRRNAADTSCFLSWPRTGRPERTRHSLARSSSVRPRNSPGSTARFSVEATSSAAPPLTSSQSVAPRTNLSRASSPMRTCRRSPASGLPSPRRPRPSGRKMAARAWSSVRSRLMKSSATVGASFATRTAVWMPVMRSRSAARMAAASGGGGAAGLSGTVSVCFVSSAMTSSSLRTTSQGLVSTSLDVRTRAPASAPIGHMLIS